MSGLLENLMAKADELIVALNENTKARAAGGEAAAAAPAKATRAKAAEKTVDAPKTSEADLVAKFEAVKAIAPDTKQLKAIIAAAGFASLTELRQAPGKFDETMAALEAYETSLANAVPEEDDL